MKAATISWLGGVATIRQALGVAVVADTENLSQVAGGDDAADLQSGARRSLGELFCHAHIDLFQGDAVGRLVGQGYRFYGCHFAHVNGLVYTQLPDYNAQHVAARTVVRAP